MNDLPPASAVGSASALVELARIVVAENTLESVMERVAHLAKEALPGAAEVSVTLVERGRPTTVAFTGPLAMALDERQYALGRGPCVDSLAGGEVVVIRCMRDEQRWEQWAQEAYAQGARSSLSVPVPIQREVSVALNIYAVVEDSFDADSVGVASTFGAYAGVAMANMHLYATQAAVAEQLQEAMQSRAVIEQAKGIIMGRDRCSAENAFSTLVKKSQDANRKLRDMAQDLVDEITD